MDTSPLASLRRSPTPGWTADASAPSATLRDKRRQGWCLALKPLEAAHDSASSRPASRGFRGTVAGQLQAGLPSADVEFCRPIRPKQ